MRNLCVKSVKMTNYNRVSPVIDSVHSAYFIVVNVINNIFDITVCRRQTGLL